MVADDFHGCVGLYIFLLSFSSFCDFSLNIIDKAIPTYFMFLIVRPTQFFEVLQKKKKKIEKNYQ